MLDPIYADLLDAALASECGIRIPSGNGPALKQNLYLARATDERFLALRITNSPDSENEVWIVPKRSYTPSHGRYAADIWDEDLLDVEKE